MKKKGLGKGLDQLLPLTEDYGSQSVQELSIADIDPNESQPRQNFQKETLEQLAASIQEVGILQPILVVPVGRRYRIVAGERRFRAARMAGLSTVPAIIKDMDQLEQMEAALVENLQREDLNPVEEALALQALMKQYQYTQEKLAKRLGKSRSAIANLLRILSLPEEVLLLIQKGDLS
ncbi:MAG: ParB/RepB/Spo0J family partition protein, partial [Clostridiales bacterium]|nr:ParB/RepB/Spo0J family partition protein [Clostridiales bacterium]